MVQVPIRPGRTEVQLLARGRASTIPPELSDVPGGLYPLHSAAYEIDEYRVLSGWPVPVPDHDIRIECLVSGEGDVLGNRTDPTALITGADMRWVADASYYDQVACRWAPIQGESSPWTATPNHVPSLVTDYEYRAGDERFTSMSALNFDSDTGDYLEIDLTLAMGGVEGYTVLMVMSPNSVYGDDQDVVDNALWSPPETTGNWMSFTVKDQAVYLTTESIQAQRGVSIGNALGSTAPTYLALVVGRPQTTMYAASGPDRVLSVSLATGATASALSTRFWLGASPSATSATMDMALLDLGLYGRLLTRSEVVAEVAALSGVYGGE